MVELYGSRLRGFTVTVVCRRPLVPTLFLFREGGPVRALQHYLGGRHATLLGYLLRHRRLGDRKRRLLARQAGLPPAASCSAAAGAALWQVREGWPARLHDRPEGLPPAAAEAGAAAAAVAAAAAAVAAVVAVQQPAVR